MVMQIKEKAMQGLEALKKSGAEECACSASLSTVKELSYENDRFTLYRGYQDWGLSMKAITQGRYGVLAGNDWSDQGIQQLAQQCLETAEAADPDEFRQFSRNVAEKALEDGPLEFDETGLFNRGKELVASIQQQFPLIQVMSLILTYAVTEACTCFSSGSCYQSKKGAYALSLTYAAHREDQVTSFFGTGLQFKDLNQPLMEMGNLKREFDEISRQLGAESFKGKFKGTIVLTPDCVGEMAGSLLENFTGDTALMSGSSPWKDQLGQKVADPTVSVHIRPRDSRFLQGGLATEEGEEAEDYTLIHQGVLKSFSLSGYAARKTKQEAAKNSECPNYMIIEPGSTPLDDLIAQVDKGLYVMRFSGGAPAVNGDFSGVAKNAFLIEKGQIKTAVKEVMISGNLGDLFRSVRGISAQHVNSGTMDLPWMVFDGVTISGS